MRTRRCVYSARNGARCGMRPESLRNLGGQLRVCGVVLRRRDLLVAGRDNPLRAVGGLPAAAASASEKAFDQRDRERWHLLHRIVTAVGKGRDDQLIAQRF